MNATMTFGIKIVALFALLGFVAVEARADEKANAAGTWRWTRKTQDGQEQEISAKFKQEGEKLTGTITSPLGETEIKDGKVKDGEVSFHITFERDGNQFTAKFSGKLTGDKIKGKVEVGEGDNKRTLPWEPKRDKKELK